MTMLLAAVLLSAIPALAKPITSYDRSEPHLLARQQPTCPAFNPVTTVNNAKLPDPFTFISGRKVTTAADWTCRRNEISSLLQNMELGIKPGKPSSVTGTLSGNSLSITCTNAGKSINFRPTITYPSSGTAPFPAIIGIGGINIPQPSGVAVINLPNDDLGAQVNSGSRNKGKFFDLYGQTGAGAMIAWAWGVSRVIDVLEQLGSATTRIDATKLGVNGCSRNGKGALVAGAFDDRIALTIPQESGSGGVACWRISNAENNNGDTQTASEIVTENVWFSTNFTRYANGVNVLPFDHHMLLGLVAPRGLLSIDNTAYQWLGPESDYGCVSVGRKVWQALGVQDRAGESQVGGHAHCSFPANQQADLDAFVNRFLRGQNVNTNIFKTDGSGGFTFNEATWVDWTTPTLR